MKWIIRNGVHFWLQDSALTFVVNWGDRTKARLFYTKEQAQTVVDALLKTRRYRGFQLQVEEFRPDFASIPPDLLRILVRCAEMLAAPPRDGDLCDFWAQAALWAVRRTKNYLTDFRYVDSDAVRISSDLLEDLQECADRLNKLLAPPEDATKVDPESQAAVADFARKTLELVNEIQGVRGDAA